MKRFNLLLVTQESGLREVVLKVLSKVYKSNFVFEVTSIEEAIRLLSKLSIDILMVDLDGEKADLVELNRRFPHLKVMGISANPNRTTANIDPMRNQIFEKRDFEASFFAELKDLKKAPASMPTQIHRKSMPMPAESEDFKDFSMLSERIKTNR